MLDDSYKSVRESISKKNEDFQYTDLIGTKVINQIDAHVSRLTNVDLHNNSSMPLADYAKSHIDISSRMKINIFKRLFIEIVDPFKRISPDDKITFRISYRWESFSGGTNGLDICDARINVKTSDVEFYDYIKI